ncbi:hypothetical protein GA0074692_3956 [Micromonospora pallida]|uniref:Uncharacterized protein n=1 Tax=Micromonospora pallida TaxID=145854 RepID=A0A1C6SZF1_9ACTN|nr:hypothetical protein GA0074692_3956 [Micromonospora pallida]
MALPGAPVPDLGWHDDYHDYVLPIGEGPSGDNMPAQLVTTSGLAGISAEEFQQARGRLIAGGWDVTEMTAPDGGSQSFVASRRGLVSEWELATSLQLWFWRHEPARVQWLTLMGWVLGAALGAAITWRVSRISGRRLRTGLLASLTTLVLVLAVPTAAAAMCTTANLLERDVLNGQPKPVWLFHGLLVGSPVG